LVYMIINLSALIREMVCSSVNKFTDISKLT